MNFAAQNITFIVYQHPINMHRSFNGLLSLAISELNVDPHDDVYVLFMNRDRNQFKILFFQYGHVSIFTMRLSGRIQEDFTKIKEISSCSFHQLIKRAVSRKHRLGYILNA